MTAYEAQRPIFRVRCDGDDCTAEFQSDDSLNSQSKRSIIWAAGRASWDVPPLGGKGSRRGTHFCPQHARR